MRKKIINIFGGGCAGFSFIRMFNLFKLKFPKHDQRLHKHLKEIL